MALGPGKYDDKLTVALDGESSGILMIMAGPKGPGFSCQCTPEQFERLPKVLRMLADEMEADNKRVGGE